MREKDCKCRQFVQVEDCPVHPTLLSQLREGKVELKDVLGGTQPVEREEGEPDAKS